MRHVCYYTRGNIIHFSITEENHYMVTSVVNGSDQLENLGRIIETYNVHKIERID